MRCGPNGGKGGKCGKRERSERQIRSRISRWTGEFNGTLQKSGSYLYQTSWTKSWESALESQQRNLVLEVRDHCPNKREYYLLIVT